MLLLIHIVNVFAGLTNPCKSHVTFKILLSSHGNGRLVTYCHLRLWPCDARIQKRYWSSWPGISTPRTAEINKRNSGNIGRMNGMRNLKALVVHFSASLPKYSINSWNNNITKFSRSRGRVRLTIFHLANWIISFNVRFWNFYFHTKYEMQAFNLTYRVASVMYHPFVISYQFMPQCLHISLCKR